MNGETADAEWRGQAIEALRADRDVLLGIGEGLSPEEWSAPSACAGWSVHDVFAHMGALFWLTVDPSQLPDATGSPTEQANELHVAARRTWESQRVLEDYESVSTKAIERLDSLQQRSDLMVPLGDLGTYPAPVLANAFAFDHFTHLRADLFAPRGPLPGPAPGADDLRVAAALEWVFAALPQQNPGAFASLRGWLALTLSGPGAVTRYLGPDQVAAAAPAGEVVATVECGTLAFVLWATQRARWDEVEVAAAGDEATLQIAQTLHVF